MEIYWLEQNESDVPIDNQWLSPEESMCLHTLRFLKRRNDWRLGRWTAKHALATCLHLPTDFRSLAKFEIHAAPSGAPEVFLFGKAADVAISLSHRSGTSLCTVGHGATKFGCDLERVEARSDAFVDDYFTASEQALFASVPVRNRPLLLAVLWSAKESALKALRVGLRLDTRSMCVIPGESHGQLFQLPANSDAWCPVDVRHSGSELFRGWWRVEEDLVRTVVSDVRIAAPRHARAMLCSPAHSSVGLAAIPA
jgi:4'-phosphopantetheinyl transferase